MREGENAVDHLKSVEGRLAFHRAEIERLEIARKVILEIDQREGSSVAAKPTKKVVKASQPKKRTFVKSANGKPPVEPTRSSAKEKIIELLMTNANLTSGVIMAKIGMGGSPQAKQRVYTALSDLKKQGRIAVDGQHQYRLAVAA